MTGKRKKYLLSYFCLTLVYIWLIARIIEIKDLFQNTFYNFFLIAIIINLAAVIAAEVVCIFVESNKIENYCLFIARIIITTALAISFLSIAIGSFWLQLWKKIVFSLCSLVLCLASSYFLLDELKRIKLFASTN